MAFAIYTLIINNMKREIFHTTDLFKPYNDPDDHYDIISQFFLDYLNHTNLTHIIIDKPPLKKYKGDEDAIKELNYIFNKEVKCYCIDDIDKYIEYFKNELINTRKKVDIHICGSCEFIAKFGKKYPSIVKDKIHRIYLNSGSGINSNSLEYNVSLNKEAYSSFFNLPCKIYWLPCFNNNDNIFTIGKYGTYFSFKQKEVLSGCSTQVKNYFINALNNLDFKDVDSLNNKIENDVILKIYEDYRNIYCFPGILSSGNLTVSSKGNIVNKHSFLRKVYKFSPIKIVSNKDGKIFWKHSINIFSKYHIFQINNLDKYQFSMTRVLSILLRKK